MENSLPRIEFRKDALSDVEKGMSLEWILTNGLGGYASSSVLGINTRKYHGVLVASFNPPVDRRVMLSKLDEQFSVDSQIYPLGSNEFSDGIYPKGYENLESFSQFPFPTFTYSVGNMQLTKTIVMPYQKNATVVFYEAFSPLKRSVTLQIFPLVNSRHFHETTNKDKLGWSLFQETASGKTRLQTAKPQSTLIVSSTAGRYVAGKDRWVEGIFFRRDSSQGTACYDDCYVPGGFEIELKPEEKKEFYLVAVADKDAEECEGIHASIRERLRGCETFCQKESGRLVNLLTRFHSQHPTVLQKEWLEWLIIAADSFVVKRSSTRTRTVIAGYHWFEDWGRDSLISLPGLTLVTGRFDDAREILLTFKHYCSNGIIPNRFPDKDGEKPIYNTVDATLWYFNAVLQYLKYTADFNFVQQKLWTTLQSVVDHHMQGTINNIHMDNDGLITHGPQLTWMDAMVGNNPITPREGKAVEIQALWYNALRIMELLANHFGEHDSGEQYRSLAEEAAKSFKQKFWNEEKNYLFDAVTSESRDASLRPNQIFSVSLDFSMLDKTKQAAVVSIVNKKLWVACGLKTLSADHPEYRRRYVGNWAERNYAYHNGTAWPWLIGPFVTAFLKVKNFDPEWRAFAFNNFLQPLFKRRLYDGGVGTLGEVFDGAPPHLPGGCIAQAWSVAEPLRAYVEDVLLERPRLEKKILTSSSATKIK